LPMGASFGGGTSTVPLRETDTTDLAQPTEIPRPAYGGTMAAPVYTLNDGTGLPIVGFGTYPLRGDDGYIAMRSALENGYRLIDTAVNYRNEVEAGRAVRDFLQQSGTSRKQIVVQTKIPGHQHSYDSTSQACLDSLQLDRIDVVLLHSPNPTGMYFEAWRALIDLQKNGTVRSIGISNFSAKQLANITSETEVVPAIHQLELHPHHVPKEIHAENARLGIVTQSWNPLASGCRPFADGPVAAAAMTHDVTPDQVVLRWQLQLHVVPLPMAKERTRQVDNLDLFGFALSVDEMAAISALAETDQQTVSDTQGANPGA